MSPEVAFFLILAVAFVAARVLQSKASSAFIGRFLSDGSNRARKTPSRFEYIIAIAAPFLLAASFLAMVALIGENLHLK